MIFQTRPLFLIEYDDWNHEFAGNYLGKYGKIIIRKRFFFGEIKVTNADEVREVTYLLLVVPLVYLDNF